MEIGRTTENLRFSNLRFSMNCLEVLKARSQLWWTRSSRIWMRSSQDVDEIDLAEWLERLTANSAVATVLTV
jgi:hypothetical protein